MQTNTEASQEVVSTCLLKSKNDQAVSTDEDIVLIFEENFEDSDTKGWHPESTKLLIQLYKEKKILVENGKIKTQKRMWEQIGEIMKLRQYNFTATQLENKWKSLKRSYKNMIENKNKIGRGRKHCPYEKEISEILGNTYSACEEIFITFEEDSEEFDVKGWRPEPTKLLIQLYKEKKMLVEDGKIKTQKIMWEQIKEIMKLHKYNFTAAQLENKWKSLERSYKKMIENKNKTGRGRKYCPYEKELSEVLAKRHSVHKVFIIGGQTEDIDLENNSIETPIPEEEEKSSNHQRKTKPNCNQTNVVKELRLLREEINKRQEFEKKKMEQRESFLKLYKERNALLEKMLERNK